MVKFFLRIFDFFQNRRRLLFSLLALICLGLVGSTLTLKHNENILDFLPIDKNHRKAMNIYQNLSAADQIIALVQYKDSSVVDPYTLTTVVDELISEVSEKDTLNVIKETTYRVSNETILEVTDFIYNNIALFLTEEDYTRMQSVLNEDYISSQLQADKAMLMFPTGGLLSDHIQQDPLNLFTPTVQKLQDYQTSIQYSLYDDYIFTKDMKKAIVMIRSPYGSNETNNNAKLVSFLSSIVQNIEQNNEQIEIHLSGAPVIAVSNSNRIKIDSFLSIIIALVLILALLLFVFRSLRSLLQIGVSVAFGMLFALGLISLFREEVSMIILGIASIILGIAVNYPLHLIAHLKHESNMRSAMREIVSPLVVGNITTVGAFLCLVAMTAPALRDFGLFAAFMLIGTIVFVIIFLPHFIKEKQSLKFTQPKVSSEKDLFGSFEKKPIVMIVIALLSVVFAYFSQFTLFDTNMSNINYMTKEQRADMAAFEAMLQGGGKTSIYVVSEGSTWDEALIESENSAPSLRKAVEAIDGATLRSATAFLPSESLQKDRIERWSQFVSDNRELLTTVFTAELGRFGFKASAFSAFSEMVAGGQKTLSWEEFKPLTDNLFSGYLSRDEELCTLIEFVDVESSQVSEAKATISSFVPTGYNFDIQGLNSSLASSLSDDFNAACWSCGLIVFFFLWLSFGRIELSIISFLPMAISWFWILGIMYLTGIQFNIVNIILATFIFGQGDDYTIFMTEGLIYEYAYGRKLLKSYKQSIVISAAIMLIGIGSLIIAKHPAMHSLAQVTIIGMSAVLLMAYILPPFLFNLLTRHPDGRARLYPLTLRSLWNFVSGRRAAAARSSVSSATLRPQLVSRYYYKGLQIERSVAKTLKKYACFAQWVDVPSTSSRIVVLNSGYGEFALLYALAHPEVEVLAFEADKDSYDLSRNLAELPSNLRFVNSLDGLNLAESAVDTLYFGINLSPDQRSSLAFLSIIELS